MRLTISKRKLQEYYNRTGMKKLFSEFQPSTRADWENQVLKDLKGESPENLIWKNENGIEIKPFYTKEDTKQNYSPAFTHCDWEVTVHHENKSSESMNLQFLTDLNRGATAISLRGSGIDFEKALKDIQLNFIQATFYLDYSAVKSLKAYLEKQYSLSDLHLSIFPLDNFSDKQVKDWSVVQELFGEYPNIKTLSLDLSVFANQSCLPFYELAMAFSQLSEYLQSSNQKEGWFRKNSVIKTSVDADFFMQIAKLRAYRRLWAIIRKEFQLNNDLHLIVTTASTNKSLSDPYNNLLRSTMETMSAVIGGCNELVVAGYDDLLHDNESLSKRMAINQQLIMKHETYLDKMADISCGAYYIEVLTDELAEKALSTFKEFEKQGGYFACLEKSVFSEEIRKHAAQKKEAIEAGKAVVLGVNKFRNEKEQISISKQKLNELQGKAIYNPVLAYELEHFFKA